AAKKSGRRSTAKGRSNGKVFVAAGKRLLHCPDSRPLAAIYLLEQSDSGAVSIGGLGAREALMALLAHSFLLDLEEQAMLRRHFTQLSSLVRQAGVFSLS